MSTADPQSESLHKDVRRGLEGPARDVAQVLFNLAKTTRSFGFYARDNAAVYDAFALIFASSQDAVLLAELGRFVDVTALR